MLELNLFDLKRGWLLEPFVLFIFVGVEGMSVLFKDILVIVSWKEHSLLKDTIFGKKGINCEKEGFGALFIANN